MRKLLLVLALAWVWGAAAKPWAERLNELFAIDSSKCIIAPEDCGLANGTVTFSGRIDDLGEVRGFYAPPYYSSDFTYLLRVRGGSLKPCRYEWRPECLYRVATNDRFKVETRLYPVAGERAAIMEIVSTCVYREADWLRLESLVAGGVAETRKWGFSKPPPSYPESLAYDDCVAVLSGGGGELAVALPGGVPVVNQLVKTGERHRCFVVFAIGKKGEAVALAKKLHAVPAATIERAKTAWKARVERLAARFPALETDNPQLERLYARSLLHFLLNEWNLADGAFRPFYATGGMMGGCLGCYLWNYGEVYRMWPMLDPAAAKVHLKKFLSLPLTACYAYDVMTDSPFGPYYPVNQEKVLLLARDYLLQTGDRAFLNEAVDTATVFDKLMEAALAHDDPAKPVALVDYGDGNHHLELRQKLRYDGVIPDMNLRRAIAFRLMDDICRLGGRKAPVDLVARAAALKKLCREKLWDAQLGWFHNVERSGRVDTRWTMQMFKALGFGDWALDADVAHALVRHLMDESEFLGPYGVHSLSKKDPAYDETDVDNGGPGACVSFAPALVDRLYRDGRVQEAENIFRRLWWLADSLPYWGDSHYADRRDYRRDTPLMNDIQGGALAQTVIFGLFGVEPRLDGSVQVTPHLPAGVGHMALKGVRMGGRVFDVVVTAARGVEVTCDGREHWVANGRTVTLPAKTAGLVAGGVVYERRERFVFDVPKGAVDFKWPEWKAIPIEGGYAYKMTAMMHTEDFLPKKRLSFSLAVYDAAGAQIRGAGLGTVRLVDNDPRSDGWHRVEGVSKVLPLEAKQAKIYFWAPDGEYGRVMVEDVKVVPVAANPLDTMYTSCPRDAAAGEVRFSAAYVVNPALYPAGGLRAEVEYLSINGWKKMPAEVKDGLVRALLPVADFALGTYRVTFRLYAAESILLGETDCDFTRLAAEPRRRVSFDAHHRTCVDGRRFFPLGMFSGKDMVNDKELDRYLEAPFNCVMPYNMAPEQVDLCWRRGLMTIFHHGGWHREIKAASPEKANAIVERYFNNVVRRLRGHPGLLAWYTADEMPPAFAPILKARNDATHALDPDHPTWAVLDQTGSVRPLGVGFDCLGMDPYPIGNRGDVQRTAIGIASGWALSARERMYDARPMWHVPQTFNWAHYRGKNAKPAEDRWPTSEEMRSMAWQPIAAGANGLVFYAYYDIWAPNRQWTPELRAQKWSEVVAIAKEVKAAEAVLLSDPGPDVIVWPAQGSSAADVVARTYLTDDGRVHVLACNRTRGPWKGELRLADGSSLALDLAPLGVYFK